MKLRLLSSIAVIISAFLVTIIHNACSPLRTDVASLISHSEQGTSENGDSLPPPQDSNPQGFVGKAELPRVYVDTTMPVQSGQTINVSAGGDFQAALNSAQPGDTIILSAGSTYIGNYNLPFKNNPEKKWIIIKSSLMTQLPLAGHRVSPTNAVAMAKIISPNVEQVIVAAQGASYYRFMGLEITDHGQSSPYGPALPGGGTGGYNQGLIDLGQIGRDTQISHLPHHIIFDRCFIHGQKNSHIKYGVSMEGAHQAVIDSYLSDFHGIGQDTQAIRSLNGTGPFKIVNNFLEGAGENVMFGGADPTIVGVTPSDIEMRRNYIFKPRSWQAGHPSFAGIQWLVKNLFETKNAQRLLFEANILENSWPHGQTGFGFVLKSANQDGNCSWCVSQDIVIRYNIMRNTNFGASISTLDEYSGGGGIPQRRVTFTHNLFENTGYILFQITGGSSQGPQDYLEITHNTVWDTTAVGDYPTALVLGDTAPVVNHLKIYDNVFVTSHDGGTSARSSSGWGLPAFNAYTQSWDIKGNAYIMNQETNAVPHNRYVPRASAGFVNYTGGDFQLSVTSPLKNTATDGTDPGADILLVKSKTSGTLTGN